MEHNQEENIRGILRDSRTIAVVGLSDDPTRPSYGVARYLQRRGYRIIPVNPNISEVLGERAYPSLESVPEHIDVVDVFRRPQHVTEVVDAAARKGITSIWFQDGVGSPESEQRALEAGMRMVSNTCMLREHRRLSRQGLPQSA
jgi:uncharacterized protein